MSSTVCTVCETGDIRLVQGSTQYNGQVEVCVNRGWGTICATGWDNVDAAVVCQQLGFSDRSELKASLKRAFHLHATCINLSGIST